MSQQPKLDAREVLNQALELPGEIAPYYSYFHPYSFVNMTSLYVQGAREIVGTKKQWASVSRHVTPRSERYSIWVPIIVRKKLDDGTTEEIFTGRYNYIPCIHTLSQTTGEPIQPKEVPGWHIHQMLGKLAVRMTGFHSQSGNLQGYAHGTEIAISPIAANPFKTTIHEVGHVLLGHTLEHGLDDEHYHRGVAEFQAEAVAYLVLNELGAMDEQTARQSRGYIRHWLNEEKPPEAACRQVLTVANRILVAGRLPVTQENTPPVTAIEE